MARKAVDRALARGRTKMIERSLDEARGVASRLAERSDGARLTRAAQEIEVLARDVARQGLAAGPDLRSELARRVAELSNLAGETGLQRAPTTLSRDADDGPAPESADGEGQVFDEWIEELRARGMTEPEIEEHVVAILSGLRAQMMAESSARLVAGGF
jgi:hypothetical protein